MKGLQEEPLDEWDRASVREMKREYERAVRLPEALVRELAETGSLAYEAWVAARRASDFPTFAPWLKKMFGLKRQEAACLSDNGHPYDPLLDEFEPGMKASRLDSLFKSLRPALTDLLGRIQDSPRQPDPGALSGRFDVEQQREFAAQVLSSMGFEWDAGRLDVSPHPFCSGLTPRDVRITTRYSEDDFSKSLFGVVHEGGHALYEQGLDAARYGQPVCQSISLGIHESQSRLWENFVARSLPFWEHWYPSLRVTFPDAFSQTALEDFIAAINLVKASLIRVDADEVTYGLHVILRYELEKSLLEDDLAIEDLSAVWDERMEAYLGVRPANAAEGVLQDTHWSQGLVGYFPTYLLGTLYAAQFYRVAQSEIADFTARIGRGDFLPLRHWLGEKIHRPGRLLGAESLVEEITGEGLNEKHFLDYLSRKYGEIYDI